MISILYYYLGKQHLVYSLIGQVCQQSLLNLLWLAKHSCSSLVMLWVLGCISLYLGPTKNQQSGLWYCGVYRVIPGVVAPSMHASLAPTIFYYLFYGLVFVIDSTFSR